MEMTRQKKKKASVRGEECTENRVYEETDGGSVASLMYNQPLRQRQQQQQISEPACRRVVRDLELVEVGKSRSFEPPDEGYSNIDNTVATFLTRHADVLVEKLGHHVSPAPPLPRVDEVGKAPVLGAPVLLVRVVGVEESQVVPVDVRELRLSLVRRLLCLLWPHEHLWGGGQLETNLQSVCSGEAVESCFEQFESCLKADEQLSSADGLLRIQLFFVRVCFVFVHVWFWLVFGDTTSRRALGGVGHTLSAAELKPGDLSLARFHLILPQQEHLDKSGGTGHSSPSCMLPSVMHTTRYRTAAQHSCRLKPPRNQAVRQAQVLEPHPNTKTPEFRRISTVSSVHLWHGEHRHDRQDLVRAPVVRGCQKHLGQLGV